MSDNYSKIIPRRGTAAEWELIDPLLLEGEIGVESPDDGIGTGYVKMKFGDGIHKWTELPYAINQNEATSIVAGGVLDSHLISVRVGTTSEWESADPILDVGEPAYDSTIQGMKVGDGIHKYSELRYIGKTWETQIVNEYGDLDDPTSITTGILRPKRGKASTLKNLNPPLLKGEIVFELPDNIEDDPIGRVKIGDGSRSWNDLPYFLASDIKVYDNKAMFPVIGKDKVIYIAKDHSDDSMIYFWTGSAYESLSPEIITYTIKKDGTDLILEGSDGSTSTVPGVGIQVLNADPVSPAIGEMWIVKHSSTI